MITLITRLLQGVASFLLANGILRCIKTSCIDHGLPQSVNVWLQAAFFFGGFMIQPERGWNSVLAVLVISCLGAMAYTDYHTRQIYVFYSRGLLVAGYGLLLFSYTKFSMSEVLLYLFMVLAGVLLRAYTLGDAELLAAVVPYFILTIEQNQMGTGVCLLLYYWMTLVLWAVNFLLYILVKHYMEIKFPMAPFLYAAMLLWCFFEYFL